MSTRTLLVVTADTQLADRVRRETAKLGWVVHVANGYLETMRGLYEYRPSVVIIHMHTDNDEGAWTTYNGIRTASPAPILCVAATTNNEERIRALERGADDVVGANASAAEIVVRVQNLVRTYERSLAAENTPLLSFGELCFDPKLHSVRFGDRCVTLTPSETRLLQRFLQEPDRLLTLRELAVAIWNNAYSGHERAVKVYVHRLRRKLTACDPHTRYLVNERTLGYRFCDET